MLDDDEFRQAMSLRETGSSHLLRRQFDPVLQEYERITGVRETNVNAFFHHVLSLYGPPCAHCHKPLRTPQAKLCGSCMRPVASVKQA